MNNTIEELVRRYPSLEICVNDIQLMFEKLVYCFENGGRLYICGNGGSASDALHIVGELVKSFIVPRPIDSDFALLSSCELANNLQGALPAFALVENVSLSTAYANDVNPDYVFAQQVYAYARKGDCVLGISTSGNSKNVINALNTAHCRGAVAMGLTGRNGGKMRDLCDVCIVAPAIETYKIQELHLPIYHALCMMIETHFWLKDD